MVANLRELPISKRIRLVEDLWDSIAEDQAALSMTGEQRAELDRRLVVRQFEQLHLLATASHSPPPFLSIA